MYVVTAAALVWIVAGLHNPAVIVPGICLLLSTYLMMELNNGNALIRIYSRMVSCAFLVFMLGMVCYYTLAFRCYQDTHAPGWTFYAYFCIGMVSIVWVQILFFLPVFWIVMRTNLLALSIRNFFASVLGVMLPYWFFAGYLAAKGDISFLADHFTQLAVFGEPLFFSSLKMSQIVIALFVLICAAIGIVHFLNQKHNDSIRTRLFYQIFITIDLSAAVFLFLQPRHYEALLSMLIVTTAPLIAHFFALTHTRLTNWIFILLSYAAVIIMLVNLWTFLHTSF